jgi:hypothetical protein
VAHLKLGVLAVDDAREDIGAALAWRASAYPPKQSVMEALSPGARRVRYVNRDMPANAEEPGT